MPIKPRARVLNKPRPVNGRVAYVILGYRDEKKSEPEVLCVWFSLKSAQEALLMRVKDNNDGYVKFVIQSVASEKVYPNTRKIFEI